MKRSLAACLIWAFPLVASDGNLSRAERTRLYLTALIRLNTTNPPGNETLVADYLKQVADSHRIPAELLGPDPKRLNFVARLRGDGSKRPLLLIAHTDVVPADRSQWTVDPFSGEQRAGYIFGRGAIDAKSLLAAHLSILVELRRRAIPLTRDIILLAEADEESGSSGIQWLIANAYSKIDAEFALNEGGYVLDTRRGRLYNVQTAEKIPTRLVLTARGTAAHASLPRPDNPVVRLSRAIARLADADQPVRLHPLTRRYLRELSRIDDFHWLQPLLPRLEHSATAVAAANQIRARDSELDAMLRASFAPTMLRAGAKINVIPNSAQAHIDVRRLPHETREEILSRARQIVNDTSIEVAIAPGQQMPFTEPTSTKTALYHAIEHAAKNAGGEFVLPFMSRGATDASYLRARGMPVYGVPLFAKEAGDGRAHGNDERISLRNLDDGVETLWQIVMQVSAKH
jgi:acetylornithine deacetylase/succinyl-diaminopimelate desuccinylase-like protein